MTVLPLSYAGGQQPAYDLTLMPGLVKNHDHAARLAATLVGLPYVQRLRGHVNVDLIPISLALRPRFLMAILTSALSIAIVSVMLFYGYEYLHFAWERGWISDTVWGVRLWIPHLSIPVGFGLLLL